MHGLPEAKALVYSQLSSCVLPPDKDTGPDFTATSGKAVGPKHSLLLILPALQRARFYLAPLHAHISFVWEQHTRVNALLP